MAEFHFRAEIRTVLIAFFVRARGGRFGKRRCRFLRFQRSCFRSSRHVRISEFLHKSYDKCFYDLPLRCSQSVPDYKV